MREILQRIDEFWQSGTLGKSVIVLVPAVTLTCCCVLSGLGLGLIAAPLGAVPIGTGTATVTLTYGPGTGTAVPTPTATSTLEYTPTLSPTGTDTLTPTNTRTPRHTATPNPNPPTETPVGFTIVLLTSPVSRGQNATLEISTTPKSSCSLIFITPQGTTSSASGLGTITANKGGVCVWSWLIDPSTKRGNGKLIISAGGVTRNQNIKIQ